MYSTIDLRNPKNTQIANTLFTNIKDGFLSKIIPGKSASDTIDIDAITKEVIPKNDLDNTVIVEVDSDDIFFSTNDTTMLKYIAENDPDINSLNRRKQTKLFKHNIDVNITQILIDKGININHQDNYGCIALFYIDNIDVIKLLISKGIDVNIKNYDGITYLDFLCVNKFSNTNEKIKTLITEVDNLVIEDLAIYCYKKSCNCNNYIYSEYVYNLLCDSKNKSKTKSASKISNN